MARLMASMGALSWRGKDLSPQVVIDLYRNGAESRSRESRRRIQLVRDLRRKTLAIKLSQTWTDRNPEAALWVRALLPERSTLERDLIARIAAVDPVYACEPLGFTERDIRYAEEKEGYMEEWRVKGVPFQGFAGKGMEDGEYGRVTLPSPSDMDGLPDFFDKLTEKAYAALKEDEKADYVKDDGDTRNRYVKVDKSGAKQFNQRYDRNKDGQSRAEHSKAKHAAAFARDHAKSEEAHADAVRRYLVSRDASTTRIIPALDCVPYFVRGTGKQRWKLAALVQRALYDREELLEGGYGWVGMGDGKLLPRGYGGTKYAGKGSQIYVYTAYLTSKDDAGRERPLICKTIGGAGTWTAEDKPEADRAEMSLDIDDLYAKYGIEGTLWSYHGGLHTEDDDPDYYYQPYLYPYLELILSIEGNKTAMNAATAVNAFTGYVYTPNAQLAAADPEAVVDANDNLRRPQIPGAGEISPAAGDVRPFSAATVGQDAWRTYQADMQSLRENTAVDQNAGRGDSGHAMVVQSTLSQVAKRHIRDGALDAVVASGQDHLKILHAYEKRFGVRWPLQTQKERAVGEDMRSGLDVIEFDPAWVGEDGNYLLSAAYPQEENLARIDLEMTLAERGFGNFEDVQKARGKADTMAERIKWLEDQIWRDPLTIQAYKLRVAKLRQDKIYLQVLKLQQESQLTKQGVPGMPQGVPTAAIRPGQGTGGPSLAARSRGGQMAAESGAATAMADAAAQMQVGPAAAPGVAA
jgi:hypothetical protein